MSILAHLEAPYRALGITVDQVKELLLPGEYISSLSINAVMSWRDGKFYEAELSIRQMEEFNGAYVRVESKTRKHLGVTLLRMLAVRRGPL